MLRVDGYVIDVYELHLRDYQTAEDTNGFPEQQGVAWCFRGWLPVSLAAPCGAEAKLSVLQMCRRARRRRAEGEFLQKSHVEQGANVGRVEVEGIRVVAVHQRDGDRGVREAEEDALLRRRHVV